MLEANTIRSPAENAGIRIAGEGSGAEINGSTIIGGLEGILIGAGADVTVRTTQVSDASTGIRIYDATAKLLTNRVTGNGTGLVVAGSGRLETAENLVCDNDVNLDLRDGAASSLDHNQICADGSSDPIVDTPSTGGRQGGEDRGVRLLP